MENDVIEGEVVERGLAIPVQQSPAIIRPSKAGGLNATVVKSVMEMYGEAATGVLRTVSQEQYKADYAAAEKLRQDRRERDKADKLEDDILSAAWLKDEWPAIQSKLDAVAKKVPALTESLDYWMTNIQQMTLSKVLGAHREKRQISRQDEKTTERKTVYLHGVILEVNSVSTLRSMEFRLHVAIRTTTVKAWKAIRGPLETFQIASNAATDIAGLESAITDFLTALEG